MRFKKFNDIENIRHAKIEEKPIKNYTNNIDEVHCSSPSKNTLQLKKKWLKCKICSNKEINNRTISKRPRP